MAISGPKSVSDENQSQQHPEQDIEQDLLIEDVSIDGMCGVY
jgi:mycofactocin precursor